MTGRAATVAIRRSDWRGCLCNGQRRQRAAWASMTSVAVAAVVAVAFGATAVAGLSSLAGCSDASHDAGDSTEIPEPIPPLATRVDEPSDERPGFLAVLTPKQSVDVPAPYTSARAAILVKLGDTVAQGQLLARLDDRQLRQELDGARAQARTARAAISQAVVDKRGADVVLAREKTAEANGVGSHSDVVTAAQAVAKAAAATSVARATSEERETHIAQLQAHLEEMTLVAPIAGSVALIYPQDGARVEEGHPVLRIISGGVFVKFALPADRGDAVKPGDPVDVRVDRRDALLTATVGHVSPELDAVAQMIIADADLVNPPADLQPGTVCRILPRGAPRPLSPPPATPPPSAQPASAQPASAQPASAQPASAQPASAQPAQSASAQPAQPASAQPAQPASARAVQSARPK